MSPRSGITIDYDKRAMDKFKRKVRDMRARAADVSPAWDALVQWFAEKNFQQFLSRGREYGSGWKPLKPETIRQKIRDGFPVDPLIRTGKMVHSLTLRPLGVERLGPRDMVAGSNVSYAPFHQHGTRRGLPARPLFDPEQIKASEVASFAVANWIIDGKRSVERRKRR